MIMSANNKINVSNAAITSFCRKHHIRKLSLFGSVQHGNFHSESDIDLLVEFEEEHVPGFFELVKMEDELSSLLGGRKVDMRTPNDLSRYFRHEVVERAEVLHAEA